MKSDGVKLISLTLLIMSGISANRHAEANDQEAMASLDAIIRTKKTDAWLKSVGDQDLPPAIIKNREEAIPADNAFQQHVHRKKVAIKKQASPLFHRQPAYSEQSVEKNKNKDTASPAVTAQNRDKIKSAENKMIGDQPDAVNQQKVEKIQQMLLKRDDDIAALTAKLTSVDQEADMRIKEINTLQLKINENEKLLAACKIKTSEADEELVVKNEKLAAVDREANERIKEINALQQKLMANQALLADLRVQKNNADKEIEAKNEKITTLLSGHNPPAAYTPTSADEIRDYAVGAYWGQEMESMINKKAAEGYHLAWQVILSGASDMMNNRLTVKKEKLAAVLYQLYKSSEKKTDSSSSVQDEGSRFLENYSREPGVKRSTMGYYYKVLEKGAGKIREGDTVAVVIRESLWNGKVINDMNEKGKVLVLSLNKYPALFKSVIRMMNNHGIAQIAVPPELAYGQKGRPPLIPANAVMLYQIKVVNVT